MSLEDGLFEGKVIGLDWAQTSDLVWSARRLLKFTDKNPAAIKNQLHKLIYLIEGNGNSTCRVQNLPFTYSIKSNVSIINHHINHKKFPVSQ